jgi:ParB family chromosome partitioning protein
MIKTKTIKLRISLLKTNPRQDDFYRPCTGVEDRGLIGQIKRQGQQQPIVVVPTPDGTFVILDGHRRARVMAEAGFAEILALVRYDLAGASPEAVEAEFLNYNAARRQLHPLEQARIAKRLLELEAGRPRGNLSSGDVTRLKIELGERFGMSGRNLDRYLRVLETPVEVQNAVRDGLLLLTSAARVAGVDKSVRAALAGRVRGLKDKQAVRDIVAEYLTPGRQRSSPI